jgi:hypothetical protein
MGYLKITDSTSKVHAIAADNVKLVIDGTSSSDIDLVYVGDTAAVEVKVTTAADRDTVKEAIRVALVAYQANPEGPAIEANGGKSIASVLAA